MECGACSGESMAILGAEGRGKPGDTLPAFLERPRRPAAVASVAVAGVAARGRRDDGARRRGRAAADAAVRRGQHHPRTERDGALRHVRGQAEARHRRRAVRARATTCWRWAAARASAASRPRRANPSESTGSAVHEQPARRSAGAGVALRRRPARDQPERVPDGRDDDDRDDDGDSRRAATSSSIASGGPRCRSRACRSRREALPHRGQGRICVLRLHRAEVPVAEGAVQARVPAPASA